MASGIYQIRNLKNNNIYIGSASNLVNRKRKHFQALKNNKHHNSYLQSSYNKYGKDLFVFEILFECEINTLIANEQKYIDKFHPQYNQRKLAESNFGVVPSKEKRNKISQSLKLFYSFSENRKERSVKNKGNEKLIKSMLGNKNGKGNLGKPFSKEHSQNMNIARIGNTNAKGNAGKKFPEQRKKTLSAAIKKWWANKKGETL